MALPTTVRKNALMLSAWAIALLTLTSQASASDKIYQVEMIVFERGAHSSSGDAEGWQKNVQLEYPENWQRLVDPDEEATRQAQADQEDSLRLPDDFLQTLADERGDYNQDASGSTAIEQSSGPAGPKYFEYLPEESRDLQRTRDALTRRNHYQVLFHETWLQPIGPSDNPPALVLHGGKRYGDHYELQGYIHLSVSRFLHLQTDLWFSEFSINHGQDVGYWPQLPLEPHIAEPQNSPPSEVAENHQPGSNMVNLTTQENLSWGTGAESWHEEIAEPPYLVNQISTLRQKRRMRSGELHYLDHPRFGVLIKITPQQNVGG